MVTSTKLTTVIVNQTEKGLTLKVGNRNCYARLTRINVGGEYKMQLDINWTYQEFLLQDKTDSNKTLIVNSDDCCDYERITIKESDGKLDVHRVPRKQFRTCAMEAADEAASRKGKFNWKFWL